MKGWIASGFAWIGCGCIGLCLGLRVGLSCVGVGVGLGEVLDVVGFGFCELNCFCCVCSLVWRLLIYRFLY